jgi:ABC-type transporter Mla maintaining outer membrane lipid asymmetry ATPase subunit MlaF
MTGPPQIELIDVSVRSDDDPEQAIVKDVRWSICEGERWALCGGPASGKSSLLATAAGLNVPASGVVRIFGQDLADASDADQVAWRQGIGFVFENEGRLLRRLSVAENLALPLRYHGNLHADEARERVMELLALAGLESLASAMPGRLSAATQRRVALLRALAAPIRVLFLDDPLRGLAPSDVSWWLRFLRERHAASTPPLAIVVSSYDFGPWRDDADHFAVVEDGRFRMAPAPSAT